MMGGEQNGLTYINEPAHLFVNVLCSNGAGRPVLS